MEELKWSLKIAFHLCLLLLYQNDAMKIILGAIDWIEFTSLKQSLFLSIHITQSTVPMTNSSKGLSLRGILAYKAHSSCILLQ